MKAKVEQTAIPGTEAPAPAPRKRQTQLAKAVAGDLVVALHPSSDHDAAGIAAIEQVTGDMQASDIVTRWKDQHIIEANGAVEVWEARPGFYYRKRKGR